MNPQLDDREFHAAGVMLSEAAGQIRRAVRAVTAEAANAAYLTKDWSVAHERPDGRPTINAPARDQSMQVLTERSTELAKLADEIERYSAWLTHVPEESR